ncbi:sprouty-related, EVH1 domain-containing protein 1-like [Uloborus diversus]|uniref:sprouty-related, EVH1 domain-containing protein 1-like n=1 Tax=Uloborus diversus TaxID=327109 RepID=UPI0024094226|nr:sprouty-related, EVH1 domain-containing protein 1-like [Uloborus diversus]
MVEGSPEDGNFLVRVRAQVMTRDDSWEGWVPMGGGGLSNVSVRKRIVSEDDTKPEYLICGKRISDQTMVLSCTIKRDFEYNKVMPTFHHWKTGDKKFGLTFQTAADALAFDKGVKTAVEELLADIQGITYCYIGDADEDDVFMVIDLPCTESRSSASSNESANGINIYRPTSATSSIPGDTFSVTSSPYTHPHSNQHHLHRKYLMKSSCTMPGVSSNGGDTSGLTSSVSVGAGELQKVQTEDIWLKDTAHLKDISSNGQEEIELSSLPYVQFSKDRMRATEHDYYYPSVDTLKSGKQELSGSFKKHVSTVCGEPPLLPSKKKSSSKESRQQISLDRLQCRHCLEIYVEEENHPGSCEFGPDRTLSCINHATCFSCTQCMLYHCMADTEGDFHHHPCSCDASDDHCRRRWTGLALLSIFVPCLWCYLPLRACHRCGVSCGYCGGKHEPA